MPHKQLQKVRETLHLTLPQSVWRCAKSRRRTQPAQWWHAEWKGGCFGGKNQPAISLNLILLHLFNFRKESWLGQSSPASLCPRIHVLQRVTFIDRKTITRAFLGQWTIKTREHHTGDNTGEVSDRFDSFSLDVSDEHPVFWSQKDQPPHSQGQNHEKRHHERETRRWKSTRVEAALFERLVILGDWNRNLGKNFFIFLLG